MNESGEGKGEKETVGTLSEWLLQTELKAEEFLKSFAASSSRFSSDDLDRAVSLVVEKQPLLSKAFDVLRSSDKAAPPIRSDLQRFGLRVVSAVAPGLAGWLQEAENSPRYELERLTAWAGPILAAKDAARRKEAELILGIGLNLLLSKRRLPPLVLLDLVGDAFGVARAVAVSDTRPENAAYKLIAKSKPRQIAQLSQISRLQEGLVSAAQVQAILDAGMLAAARREAEATASKLDLEIKKAADQERRIATLNAEISEAKTKLAGVQELAAHDFEYLKMRYRKVLLEHMKRLASDAVDGLEIDPPRPDFSKRYLNQLLQKIDEEMAWLNAHSE